MSKVFYFYLKTMLAEAESAIITRIEAILTGFEVAFAAFPGESDKLPKAGRRGLALIGYKRSRFRLTSMMPATCEAIIEFELSFQLRDLRSHKGAYPILDAVRYAITGFIPLKGPSHKSYPVTEGFTGFEDGVWNYSMIIAVAMLQVEGQQNLYTMPDDDYLTRDPALGVRPYAPTDADGNPIPIQIKTGVRRSLVENLEDNTLDRELTITEDS